MSTAKPVRWTYNRIRKATPFRKPQGAIARVYGLEAGHFDAGRDVTPAERGLLRHIADEADIVAETPHPDGKRYGSVVWILVPLHRGFLDRLAEFEADDREADTDREADVDREPEEDTEPSLDRPAGQPKGLGLREKPCPPPRRRARRLRRRRRRRSRARRRARARRSRPRPAATEGLRGQRRAGADAGCFRGGVTDDN